MAKAEEYIRDALLKVLKVGAEQPIEAADAQDTIVILNDMMAEWEGVGISLGFTTLTGLGDEVTIPESAKRAVKFNLAINVADQYGKAIAASTAAVASSSYTNLLNQFITVSLQSMPSTLPTGTGNTCGSGAWNRRFFEGDEAGSIERETGGSILTEDGTE